MDSERKDPDELKYNILQLLINHPNGVKFEDFSRAFYQIHNFHPKLSHYGYISLRQLFEDMKETVVVKSKKSCGSVIKLISGLNLDGLLDEVEKSGPVSFEEEDSSLKGEQRRERGEDTSATAADLTVVSVPICNILKLHPDGLKLSKLKEAVKKKCGYDLEVFCYRVGFCDIVSCLQEIPELIINRNKNRNCRIQLKPDSFSCSSSLYSHSPFDSEQPICTSKKVNQAASEKKPVLDEVMALVITLLSNYGNGLRICKLQEFLLVTNGIDLEKFSIAHGYRDSMEFMEQNMPQLVFTSQRDRLNAVVIEPHTALKHVTTSLTTLLRKNMSDLRVRELQDLFRAQEGFDLEKFSFALGHKDTVEFLEKKMPQLTLNYRTNKLNSIVIKPHSDLEDKSKPASTISDPPASDSHCQNEPASIVVVPPEVNLFHTTQSCPNTMSSNLPSFHESHNTLSVKAKSSSFSSIPSQQPSPCQPSAKSVTEETSGSSQVPIFQPSTALDELKQQVAQILAKHPKGISVFQFRIVYSATFKQHFPVGNAYSIKQRLLEMPDTVYVKGHGVQTLLFPITPDVSPAKPGMEFP
uniref:HTH OST-type domain-containing protein n=1 Tax=Micrurus lemniscatus lemniscatus TaxID=129467 RepID=A0A2D4HS18_MICLE